jgi:hypothetical protein
MLYRIEREEDPSSYQGELSLIVNVSASASKPELRKILDLAFRNAANALSNTFIQNEGVEDALVIGGQFGFKEWDSPLPPMDDLTDTEGYTVTSYEIGGDE